MDHLRPFTYFVGATGGVINLLQCTVCLFIPVVGQVVLLGYRAEVADELVRDRDLRRHPAFDFGRIGDYLARGVWPWVYQLLLGGVLLALLVGGGVVVGLVATSAVPPADPEVLLAVAALGYLPVIFSAALLGALLLWPLELHVQLSRRFAPVEALGFAARFQGRVWGQSLASVLVFLFAAGLLTACGLLCGVGVFLAVTVLVMAQQHLTAQLYKLYLLDGGAPVRGPDDGDDEV